MSLLFADALSSGVLLEGFEAGGFILVLRLESSHQPYKSQQVQGSMGQSETTDL
jgi:hypothetical protein